MPTIDIQQLLDRPTPQEVFDVGARLEDASVLVTGAGGSIGSALCRRVVRWKPRCLVAYDQSEYALYQVTQSLQDCGVPVVPVLGDLKSVHLLQRVLTAFEVDQVFHAAAYKHVPLVEQNPIIGLRNNVWGTKHLIEACVLCQIESVLVVSTDKAVNPTNVMGASKRLAEYVTLTANPKYQIVRFGNVLWSSGSVLPLFYDQLTARQPLTITHPEVSRYFMSVEEATELMLQSIALSDSILVFDMGTPVLIESMARKMATLMEIEPEVRYVGLRPGEKLHEELTLGEALQNTQHPSIKAAREQLPSLPVLSRWLADLDRLCHQGDVAEIRQMLQQIVPGYAPSCGIVDNVWLQEYVVKAKYELEDCYADRSKEIR